MTPDNTLDNPNGIPQHQTSFKILIAQFLEEMSQKYQSIGMQITYRMENLESQLQILKQIFTREQGDKIVCVEHEVKKAPDRSPESTNHGNKSPKES